MKRLNKYMMLFVAALALVSCVDDVVDTPSTEAKAGDEVQFSLTLPSSRTVYGGETTVGGKNVFPIYWVDGDKVTIFSPQCLDGRLSAEYKVILPDNGDKAYYAKDLQKTGDYGVQWGNNATANFYSLYPSGSYTLSSDGKNAEGVKINYIQNIVVNSDGSVTSDMEDCLLYAKKTGVASGETVNLHYDPISTVIYVTLKVAANETGTDPDTFTIQSVSLTADTEIAGTFSLDIANGTFAKFATGKSSKTVMAQITNPSTGGYHTISNAESFSIPLFIAPQTDLNVKNWKIQVVANNKEYTKTLNIDKVLEPGQIHKITLPELKPATTEWEVSKWMTYIPRNVYLSEVSIPGTWNSLNVDCQSDLSIGNQYANGVRAFHIDTRWRANNSPAIGSTFTGGNWGTHPEITDLSVAVGGSDKTYKYDDANLMRKNSALTFAEYLKQITDNVKEDEYMVIFVTFSQNSYNGDRCPSTWYKAVSDACAANDKVIDAKTLTQKTVVGDVLDRVIVVVNLDVKLDSTSTTLPADSKCFFTYVPMNLPQNHYDASTSHIDGLYYGSKSISGISMYTSHAQISTTNTSAVNCGDRGYSHLLSNRDALVESFWDWSKDNYGTTNYAHDKWIYLGLGGYILNSSSGNGTGYDTIENRYGPMIYDRIDAMGKNNMPFYPMGIMLMNNKKGSDYTDSNGTDLKYGFEDVCKQILMLNNKYRLQFDASKPSDYNPNAKAKSAYDGTLTTGGYAY